MIEEILAPGVVTEETFSDDSASPLFPEELALVARAVPKRRNEFTTTRGCARKALGSLGFPPAPLLTGERGAPIWPDGVVGSMTHCDGYRAAVVAHQSDFLALGIDAEPAGPLPDGVLDAIARPEELVRLKDLADTWEEVCWDRILFSAKESVYKTWFPVTQQWLGFEDASIDIDPDTGAFRARLLVTAEAFGPRAEFHGRWMLRDGLVLTAISRPR
ncbi:4'-phosphopantetheinyl transferase family protein [Saccharopolyspora pogona]|uniref:4'-phosphopantetheinyl transferase family protein n=1 Tax=Saccharopolyspora pogona TaxID=333966 RepID=UPI0016874DFE|nr:4'-phosphopantetheinyl transferase superfamily protein [Saccharopolyspora pogona]